MCVCVCEYSVRRGQKRLLDPLDLELQDIVNHLVPTTFLFNPVFLIYLTSLILDPTCLIAPDLQK